MSRPPKEKKVIQIRFTDLCGKCRRVATKRAFQPGINFEKEARTIVDALFANAPGGTWDAVLRQMKQRERERAREEA